MAIHTNRNLYLKLPNDNLVINNSIFTHTNRNEQYYLGFN
jgi:hypothetical protein